MPIKLSIITINYNNLAGLRKTVESVFAQTYCDFEYIIIDGASTDGSREYLNSIQTDHSQANNRLANLHIVSEHDTGIYNAMNKGIRIATGEYLLMLNSGDSLVDKQVVAQVLPKLDGIDIIQGNIICEYPNGLYRNRGYGKSDIDFIDAMDGNFLHQASFIRRELHQQYGMYDDTYKKNADTYFYRAALGFGNASFRYIDVDIANFDIHGVTTNPGWQQIDREEEKRWSKEHFPIRLQQLYKDAPRKMALYDTLHQSKLIWKCAMLLTMLARWLHPCRQNIKERIK